MAKSFNRSGIAAALLALAAPLPALAQPAVLGTDAAACAPGAAGHAVLVTVHGFKDRDGRLRLQYYPDTKDNYLGSGQYIRRQEMQMTPEGDMVVCITVPAPAHYVMVALHDRNSDGKLSVWSDGIGFSNNPRLALAKPALEKTRFEAKPGLTRITIVMNYRRGLSVRPLDSK